MSFKSGYVGLIGRPNTGKTTLVNRLAGQKVGIVTPKPQTTRTRVMAVVTNDKAQIIFLDSPGIAEITRKVALDENVRECALEVAKSADIIVGMFDAKRSWGQEDELVLGALNKTRAQKLIVLNKIDLTSDKQVVLRDQEIRQKVGDAEIIPISALNGAGTDHLLARLLELLPVGPLYYPQDTLTDQSERFIASEVIREKIMLLLEDEAPYGCAVMVNAFKETAKLVRIEADIIVERDSLKGMVIGKKGAMIKEIGSQARRELEKELDSKVHLELFVKVHKNWRKDPKALKELGY
jgi:GTP-binding protein Era